MVKKFSYEDMVSEMEQSLERAKQNSGSSWYLALSEGVNRIRIMPSQADTPRWWREIATHWLDKKPYNCPNYDARSGSTKDIEGTCFFCDTRRELFAQETPESVAAAKELYPRRSWIVLAVNMDKGEAVQAWRFGVRVWEQLVPICKPENDGGWGDISDLETGTDLKVSYVKNPPATTITAVRNSSQFELVELLDAENLPDIDEIAAPASYGDMQAAWEGSEDEEDTSFGENEDEESTDEDDDDDEEEEVAIPKSVSRPATKKAVRGSGMTKSRLARPLKV